MKLRIIILLVFMTAALRSADITLVKDGKAYAEIVLPANPHPAEKFAATELQFWIREITSAELPIIACEEITKNGKVKLMLGKTNATPFQTDLKAMEGSDGYAFRNLGGNIYIFGAQPKGTLNGIFRFLEANTDIIWVRPLYTVFSKTGNLSASKADIVDRPASTIRGLGTTLSGANAEDWLWQVRNCNNRGNMPPEKSMEWGLVREVGGHVFSQMIPAKKYLSVNPEFFPEINGIRKPAGCLCLTAKGIQEEYRKNLFEWIQGRMPMDILVLGIDDTSATCQCRDCLAPIKLGDGTVITQDDPAFRSTRWFQFVNPLADAVKEHFKIKTLVYSYVYLTVPPKIKVSDNIVLSFHPHPRNMKVPYEEYKQLSWSSDFARHMIDYLKVGKNMRLREYYGCNGAFPRPDEYVAVKDIRFALKHGVREFTTEYPVDQHDKRWKPMPSAYWDASAVSIWTIERLWWNPEQDLETLRNQFLERTYHEAAPAMKKYYRKIHDLWFAKSNVSTYQDTNGGQTKEHIIEAGEEQNVRDLLIEAEQAAKHPVSLELVKLARRNFEAGCNIDSRIVVKKVKSKPQFLSAEWNESTAVSDFSVFAHSELKFPVSTTVSMLHDGTNLFIRVNCQDASEMQAQESKPFFDRWIKDDFVSLHFSGTDRKGIYTFAFDRRENAFDAQGSNLKWNSGMTLEYRMDAASYDVIVTVPLSALGYVSDKDNLNRIYGVFHRRYAQKNGTPMSATTKGLPVDNSRFFSEIFLEK